MTERQTRDERKRGKEKTGVRRKIQGKTDEKLAETRKTYRKKEKKMNRKLDGETNEDVRQTDGNRKSRKTETLDTTGRQARSKHQDGMRKQTERAAKEDKQRTDSGSSYHPGGKKKDGKTGGTQRRKRRYLIKRDRRELNKDKYL